MQQRAGFQQQRERERPNPRNLTRELDQSADYELSAAEKARIKMTPPPRRGCEMLGEANIDSRVLCGTTHSPTLTEPIPTTIPLFPSVARI